MSVEQSKSQDNKFIPFYELLIANDAGKSAGIEYTKNPVEKTGDYLGYGIFKLPEHVFINFPKKVYNFTTNPITLGWYTGIAGMYGIHRLFGESVSPAQKKQRNAQVDRIKNSMRFPFKLYGIANKALLAVVYGFCQASFVGLVLRTVGRVTNDDLRAKLNEKAKVIPTFTIEKVEANKTRE